MKKSESFFSHCSKNVLLSCKSFKFICCFIWKKQKRKKFLHESRCRDGWLDKGVHLSLCFTGYFPKLLSLESLDLWDCMTLKSLPDGSQAYSSLQHLLIAKCPGLKTLPASLQQCLGSIQQEYVDAHLYGNKPRPMLLKPKTWKYVCKD